MRRLDGGTPALLALVAAVGIIGAYATVDVDMGVSYVLGAAGLVCGAFASIALVAWLDSTDDEEE